MHTTTRIHTTRAIVIATGVRPAAPPIPGIEHVDCMTSHTVWTLRKLPKRLVEADRTRLGPVLRTLRRQGNSGVDGISTAHA